MTMSAALSVLMKLVETSAKTMLLLLLMKLTEKGSENEMIQRLKGRANDVGDVYAAAVAAAHQPSPPHPHPPPPLPPPAKCAMIFATHLQHVM
jgi:hypothetical protein